MDDEQKHWPFECATGKATDSGYVGLQAIASAVGLFGNKYIALNHEWNITGNYAECTKH